MSTKTFENPEAMRLPVIEMWRVETPTGPQYFGDADWKVKLVFEPRPRNLLPGDHAVSAALGDVVVVAVYEKSAWVTSGASSIPFTVALGKLTHADDV